MWVISAKAQEEVGTFINPIYSCEVRVRTSEIGCLDQRAAEAQVKCKPRRAFSRVYTLNQYRMLDFREV